ncbi:MAG TPA: ATP-binding protein [Kofleriaceae bacterium]
MPSQQLAKRLGMIPSELAVVLLLGSISANADVRRLAAALGHQSPEDPTIDVIRTIIFGTECGRDAFAALAPAGTLRRLGVIERSDGGGADVHESRQTWAIARRVLAWLHGDTSIDPAIAAAVRIAEPKAIADVIVADETVAEVREACRAKRAVIVASGATGLGRRTLLAAAAREAGIDVLEIDARRLGKDQLRAVARECKLLGRAPLVCHADDHIEAIGRELAPEIDGPIFVTAQRAAIRWDRPAIVVHVTAPSSAQRARLWRAALPEASERDAEHLATQYPLAPALVHHAAQAIRVRAPDRSVRPADVDAGVRAVLDDRLAELARPVRVTQTWDDLVLPDEQHAAIAELCARVRQRSTVFEDWGFAAKVGKGFGTVALLSGPPGTGKTMVAGLVARELGLPLYQVDSAKITSKFIGETEKQLAQLFDAAEAGCAILLFDEADSLFGKRTQIADSNDRYANLETNYLLQRLESFTGICLLTTNHEASLDPAFQRRLALHVRFELPDETERARLWRALLPAAAPVDPGIDFADLARRFALSGGHIRNATVRAAFLAADEGTPIAEAHLEHAARVEAEAAGKLAA